MPSVNMSLQQFHDAAAQRYGDLVIDLSEAADGSDRVVFPNPMRLSDEAADWVENIGVRIQKAQADPPEIEAARDKANKAINRVNSLSNDVSAEVRTKRENEASAAREAYEAAVVEHRPSVKEQRAKAMQVMEDFVRAVLNDSEKAERFLAKAFAGDMTRALVFVEQYKGLGQVGEASPSGS